MRTEKRKESFDFYKDKSSLSFEFQFDEESHSERHHHAFIDAEGPIVNIIPPYLRNLMYPHQLDGFRFLWKKIAGATLLEDLKTPLSDGGTGCIISHAPGTGKSFLTIVFLLTFMEVHPTCRPVIIAPVTMLHAWAMELKRWKVNIPFHNLQDSELSGEDNLMAASIIQRLGRSIRDRKQDKYYKRMVKLYSWTKGRSILGLGYKLFGKLAGDQRKGNHYGEKLRKILLELPGILILDEGHTARNENSMLWKTLTKIQTSRRVILSGTPFQNNHNELYNILCLVNPNFAESIPLKAARFDRKRKNGSGKERWESLTSLIDEDDYQAAEELRAMMAPFVHVHKGNVLEERLPGLRDTLVVLNPSELQKLLVHQILGNVQEKYQKANRNFFEKVHLVSLVSVHPSLVSKYEEFSDKKSILEEAGMNPELGVKTQFVIEIVRLSNARNEKVLVFSEYIDPLNFLMKQLTSYFSWEDGKQVLYMDGKLGDKQRQLVISSLNAHNSEAKVLLASVKACSEGISLVGASRVVLLDVVWNPSFQRQAICRAYRLGQKKIVYIYHLIMSGTKLEIDKYLKQAKKDRLSEQLFPSSEGGGHNHEAKLSGDDDVLDAMVHHKKLGHIFENILPQSKESNVFENFDFVSSAN